MLIIRIISKHICTLESVGGPNVFDSCRNSNGWCTSPSLLNTERHMAFDGSPLLFWVPSDARQGLCDAQTVFPLGIPRTRVDLSRFAHGKAWTNCHLPEIPEIPPDPLSHSIELVSQEDIAGLIPEYPPHNLSQSVDLYPQQ